jgi:hypothetical protein
MHIDTKTWFDRDFILKHLSEYNREYAGFTYQGSRYVLCNMVRSGEYSCFIYPRSRHMPDNAALDESSGEPQNAAFTTAFDRGCDFARVVIDFSSNTVVRIDCNGM